MRFCCLSSLAAIAVARYFRLLCLLSPAVRCYRYSSCRYHRLHCDPILSISHSRGLHRVEDVDINHADFRTKDLDLIVESTQHWRHREALVQDHALKERVNKCPGWIEYVSRYCTKVCAWADRGRLR